jgi:hypothetical protein
MLRWERNHSLGGRPDPKTAVHEAAVFRGGRVWTRQTLPSLGKTLVDGHQAYAKDARRNHRPALEAHVLPDAGVVYAGLAEDFVE